MNRVYAKRQTNEKIVVFVDEPELIKIQEELNRTFGGEWFLLHSLSKNQIIQFSDNEIYKGFESGKENYCKSIKEIYAKDFRIGDIVFSSNNAYKGLKTIVKYCPKSDDGTESYWVADGINERLRVESLIDNGYLTHATANQIMEYFNNQNP